MSRGSESAEGRENIADVLAGAGFQKLCPSLRDGRPIESKDRADSSRLGFHLEHSGLSLNATEADLPFDMDRLPFNIRPRAGWALVSRVRLLPRMHTTEAKAVRMQATRKSMCMYAS